MVVRVNKEQRIVVNFFYLSNENAAEATRCVNYKFIILRMQGCNIKTLNVFLSFCQFLNKFCQ